MNWRTSWPSRSSAVLSLAVLSALVAVSCGGSRDPQADWIQYVPPAGKFTTLDVDATRACAIRTDGEILCWGSETGLGISGAPPFQRVALGTATACALREDGALSCRDVRRTAPQAYSGVLDVDAGPFSWCYILIGGSVGCWTERDEFAGPQLVTYGANFSKVSVGRWGEYLVAGPDDEACGLHTDGTIECWGNRPLQPEGQYIDVSVGDELVCAVAVTGSVSCWGAGGGALSTPPGTFVQVSAGLSRLEPGGLYKSHACALRTDRQVVCWGNNEFGQTTAPPGEFKEVRTGKIFTAAITTDGEIVWWGRTKFDPYRYDRID
ncbi:MAG: RCC1 domain-containing protein [Dehalococcoidia bacterium]